MNFMRLIRTLFICYFLAMPVTATAASSGVAKVIIMKGSVTAINADGSKEKLKKGAWIKEGARVLTQPKSFVKLLFTDKSQMNLGPKSEMVIEKFPKKKAGIISLMKGSLRSKVTKNYLKDGGKKSKLFVKTKSAAMGVRGTDFMVEHNPATNATNLDVVSGAVSMAKMSPSDFGKNSNDALENIVSSPRAVMVKKEQTTSVSGNSNNVPTPKKIPKTKLEALKKNDVPATSSKEEKSGKDKKTAKKKDEKKEKKEKKDKKEKVAKKKEDKKEKKEKKKEEKVAKKKEAKKEKKEKKKQEKVAKKEKPKEKKKAKQEKRQAKKQERKEKKKAKQEKRQAKKQERKEKKKAKQEKRQAKRQEKKPKKQEKAPQKQKVAEKKTAPKAAPKTTKAPAPKEAPAPKAAPKAAPGPVANSPSKGPAPGPGNTNAPPPPMGSPNGGSANFGSAPPPPGPGTMDAPAAPMANDGFSGGAPPPPMPSDNFAPPPPPMDVAGAINPFQIGGSKMTDMGGSVMNTGGATDIAPPPMPMDRGPANYMPPPPPPMMSGTETMGGDAPKMGDAPPPPGMAPMPAADGSIPPPPGEMDSGMMPPPDGEMAGGTMPPPEDGMMPPPDMGTMDVYTMLDPNATSTGGDSGGSDVELNTADFIPTENPLDEINDLNSGVIPSGEIGVTNASICIVVGGQNSCN